MRNESLLTRDQSNFIKGFLILLIVLGHNPVLMHINSEDVWLKNWLYSFHVRSFLFLPFLYNFKKFEMSNVRKNARRLLVPYSVFFLVLLLINHLRTHNFCFSTCIQAYFTGSQYLLRDVTGLIYIWFLPTMFSILMFKDLLNSNKTIKYLLMVIGIGCILLRILYLIDQAIDEYIPLGMYLAVFNIPIAYVLRLYLERTHSFKRHFVYFTLLVSILTAVWFMLHPQNYIWSLFMYVLLPISIFPLIFFMSKIAVITHMIPRFFIFLGKISMGIYLVHQIIFNTLFKFTSILEINVYIYGSMLYIATVGIAISLVLIIKRFCPKVYKIIF